MEGLESIIKFMKEKRIPLDAIDFDNIEDAQLEYEKSIFDRNIGGNALTSQKQFEYARKSPIFWKEKLGNPDGQKILDVGCGWGYTVNFLRAAGYDAHGINKSVVESELGRRGVLDGHELVYDPNVEERKIKVGDVTDLPYNDDEFDGLSSHGMLMMVPFSKTSTGESDSPSIDHAIQAMAEKRRVLRPGGVLHLITMSTEPTRSKPYHYIGFGSHGYNEIWKENGEILERGDIGLVELLEDLDFELDELKLKKTGFWHCSAKKL